MSVPHSAPVEWIPGSVLCMRSLFLSRQQRNSAPKSQHLCISDSGLSQAGLLGAIVPVEHMWGVTWVSSLDLWSWWVPPYLSAELNSYVFSGSAVHAGKQMPVISYTAYLTWAQWNVYWGYWGDQRQERGPQFQMCGVKCGSWPWWMRML